MGVLRRRGGPVIRGVRAREGWAGLVAGGDPAPDDPLARVPPEDEAHCREVVDAAAHLPRLGTVTAGELGAWCRSHLVGLLGPHRVSRGILGPLVEALGLDGVDQVEVRAGVLGPLGHDVPVVSVVSARGTLVIACTLERLLDAAAVLRLEGP